MRDWHNWASEVAPPPRRRPPRRGRRSRQGPEILGTGRSHVQASKSARVSAPMLLICACLGAPRFGPGDSNASPASREGPRHSLRRRKWIGINLPGQGLSFSCQARGLALRGSIPLLTQIAKARGAHVIRNPWTFVMSRL
jgi:hypothetical protein